MATLGAVGRSAGLPATGFDQLRAAGRRSGGYRHVSGSVAGFGRWRAYGSGSRHDVGADDGTRVFAVRGEPRSHRQRAPCELVHRHGSRSAVRPGRLRAGYWLADRVRHLRRYDVALQPSGDAEVSAGPCPPIRAARRAHVRLGNCPRPQLPAHRREPVLLRHHGDHGSQLAAVLPGGGQTCTEGETFPRSTFPICSTLRRDS